MGNSIYQEGRTTILNEFDFTPEEEKWLMNKVAQSPFHIRAGQHIASRPGSFNFSIVGRNATPEQREEYKLYDQEHKERLAIAREFNTRFPKFDIFIGGDISVDICLRGAHKGQIFQLMSPFLDGTEKMVFFGDKMGEWGIDEPLAGMMSLQPGCYSFNVKEGYNQTKHFLETSVPE
jgi:hydroxymethylpyrimidine pyrophosphatase-like HAD family hydrolase